MSKEIFFFAVPSNANKQGSNIVCSTYWVHIMYAVHTGFEQCMQYIFLFCKNAISQCNGMSQEVHTIASDLLKNGTKMFSVCCV